MADEESVLDNLAQQIDSVPIICDMNHPSPSPGQQSISCQRPSKYAATVHDCAKAAENPGAGINLTVCEDFIERAKHIRYPYRCSGCTRIIAHFVHLVWNINPL